MSNAVVNGLAGAGGGIIAQIITYPLQSVNTRQQTERVSKKSQSQGSSGGTLVQILQVIRSEGLGGLYSGLKPSLLGTATSQVVVCLLLRKTVPLMNDIQAHQEVMKKLVDLIGITSIMEVLICRIGADEHLYTSYVDSMQWLEDIDVLEMIVDKLSSTDCPEVHANAAEALCAITRYAPPGLAAKISSPSFIARLFRHALEDSRPKSVLVHSLSVCISLLDPFFW